MENYGFYVNTDICMGCKACMTACFDRNDLVVPQKFRKVWEFNGGGWKSVGDTVSFDVFAYFVSLTCNHCDVPACVAICPTGAMEKDPETGIVSVDIELCDGCMSCEQACPYNHPVKGDDGFAHKCVLCTDQNADKVPEPMCLGACPVRALDFGLIDDLRARYGEVDKIGTLGNITAPNVVIGVHRDAAGNENGIAGGTANGNDVIVANPLEISHEA